MHFRDTTLQQACNRKEAEWKQICEQKVKLPTPYITLYKQNGDFSGTYIYDNEIPFNAQAETSSDPDETEEEISDPDEVEEVSDHDEEDNRTELQTDFLHEEVQYENEHALHTFTTEHLPNYKTKLAKAIFNALGESTLLNELDEIRLEIKVNTSVDSTKRQAYTQLIRSVKAKLKIKQIENKGAITELERRFFSENKCLPTENNHEYKTLCKKAKIVNKPLASAHLSTIAT